MEKIDFKTIFPTAFKMDTHQINTVFNSEIRNLLEKEVLNTERTIVYIIERRGLNLFGPFTYMIKKFHEMGTIRLYDDKKVVGIKEGVCNNRTECIILTDAIRKGDEISRIVDSLNKSDVTVLKVCGYLSNKETIEKLRNVYNETKFEFVHETTDYSQYRDYYGKIVGVHHSRLEPLDSEHPYYIYKSQQKTSRDKIWTVIFKSCKKANVYQDQDILNSDITGYTAEFDGDYVRKRMALNTKNDFFKIERLLLRFKFDQSRSELRMMAFCDVYNFNLSSVSLIDDHVENVLPNFIRYCKFLNENSNNQKIICPLCVDVNLSRRFLDMYDYKIKKMSEKEGFFLNTIKEFDPFLNY